MRVLLLAPQPFYQLRGTPLAVKRLAGAFSRRGWQVDILTFHEGADVEIPGVRVLRSPRIPGADGVPPGFSLKKILCDLSLFGRALREIRRERYDLIHAVEESVFIGLFFKIILGLPYTYDMDSRLSEQLTNSHPEFTLVLPLLRALEGVAIRNAGIVLAVCQALADYARSQGARNIMVLPDAPLCEPAATAAAGRPGDPAGKVIFKYIGNLESYQGIDLLLDAFALLAESDGASTLEIIGGVPAHIAHYQKICQRKKIAERVHFRGEQPPENLAEYMADADVLVSPRIQGVNTPMKVYSYLQAGKAVLTTDIPSHNQVLSPEFAFLAEPNREAFARAMRELASDPALRASLGERALDAARTRFSPAAFDKTAFAYCDLAERLIAGRA